MKAVIQLFTALAVLGLAPACGEKPAARAGKTVTSGEAAIGGAFSLINHDGLAVTDESFHDKPQLVYFGFSYCPDVCPIALQKMGAAQGLLGKRGQDLNYLFISVDPVSYTHLTLPTTPYV